jgi:hypothetical protein
MTEPVNVIYPPPRDGLPFLVVTLAGKELEVIPLAPRQKLDCAPSI